MRISKYGSAAQLLGAALPLGAALLLGACGSATEEQVGGESNWFQQCREDADCDADERCRNERCVEAVDAGRASGSEGASDPQHMLDSSTPSPSDTVEPTSADAAASTQQPALSEQEPLEPPNAMASSANAPDGGVPQQGVDPQPAHCAYPSLARASAPSGVDSGQIAWLPRASGETCGYALSEMMWLSPPPATPEGEPRGLAFSYDVNADGVSDLFVRRGDFGPYDPTLELWVSEIVDGQFRYIHEPCAALDQVASARRWFVRDLNGDAVPDLVATFQNAIAAWLNTEQGFVEVLNFSWPEPNPGQASLGALEVRVADVVGGPGRDIVFGMDRWVGQDLQFEVGVLAFAGSADATEFEAPSQWTTLIDGPIESPDTAADVFWGDFAVHGLPGQPARLFIQQGQQLFPVDRESRESSAALPPSAQVQTFYQAWSTTEWGGIPLIAVLSDTPDLTSVVQWYNWDADGPSPVYGSLETHFVATPDHELGGGSRGARQYVMDVDGNTTSDFVEWGSIDEQFTLAIHRGDQLVHFTPPDLLTLELRPASDTLPFIEAAGQALGFLAYEQGVIAPGDVAGLPVQQFRCVQ